MYWKLCQYSFFGTIEDTIICFPDCLTFKRVHSKKGTFQKKVHSKKSALQKECIPKRAHSKKEPFQKERIQKWAHSKMIQKRAHSKMGPFKNGQIQKRVHSQKEQMGTFQNGHIPKRAFCPKLLQKCLKLLSLECRSIITGFALKRAAKFTGWG